MKFETKAIRLQTAKSQHREHSTPIFPTSSFTYESAEQMRDVFAGDEEGNIYSRFTNPSVREFEMKMAALEETEDAVATASGMSAIFASFVSFLKCGDHLLVSRAVFGSTYKMMENYLQGFGIEYTFLNPSQGVEEWTEAVQENTKMLFLETPSNPGLHIYDLENISKWCKKHNLLLNVDNCFATPYLQKPASYGADIICHSATKFIDGQGRVLGGLVAGKKEIVEKVFNYVRSAGPSLSPFNAWVLSKSLETLAVRMDRHCENASKLASILQGHEEIEKVNYPFLESHPQYAIAKKQMSQGGAIVTFDLKKGLDGGRKFLNALQMLSLTANLGDTRSIASHPSSTTHRKLTEEERMELGISPGLIRISVGLEHIDDISSDILQALTNI
ncbi:O-succinylhomoserine sulfhydrylase [Portibacter lacus]|uniref:O-succinylhomoserine sulfhydrylase n=1 Tax=Portibacter lacus TaxID=1099794 RepID=A0AA37STQ0_9BACT|nr:O-succinylhomoserine sulfhydrylase [Portibacter lacus]GLR17840.1 O-succinylhomoserine sulfhydrylase [Portibacter lacus]